MSSEHWRPVPGHEGSYEVSDRGRVRSLDRIVVDKRGRRRFWPGQVLRPRIASNGYLEVMLPKRRNARIHSLVLSAFIGPRPEGLQCLHGNGDAIDNRLSNLRYGTVSENSIDAIRHGRNRKSSQTECIHGHRYTPSNTLVVAGTNGRTWRNCRTCRDRWNANRYVA